jgi:putative membrane protein
MIDLSNLLSAVVFAFLGVVIFGVSFFLIDLVTPYKLRREIIEEHNSALAIVLGAISLGVCIIIAAAIHG